MRIKSFAIRNYRSIKELKIDHLNPVNVFFGKNNVGKSNILRALHLGLLSIKTDTIYLPDTMFFNRNIYKPIEIEINLILEEDFYDIEKFGHRMTDLIERAMDLLPQKKHIEINTEDLGNFLNYSASFTPLKEICIIISVEYDEDTSNVGILIKDIKSDYTFDYKKYNDLYTKMASILKNRLREDVEMEYSRMINYLSSLGISLGRYEFESRDALRYYASRRFKNSFFSKDLKIYVRNSNVSTEAKSRAIRAIDEYNVRVEKIEHEMSLDYISDIFNLIKEYFDKIPNNFILIPNKGFFQKVPLDEKEGDPIELFDIENFKDKLASFIESPNKKQRSLIRKFDEIFKNSYGDLGELEIRKFREEIFAIFDTGFTALPINDQGQGIQDLFLYLAHMILFEPAIIAIEEPEGGLSTKNQRILHDIIEKIYNKSNKQIFISSHCEEFEMPDSYVIEIGQEGSKEISRKEKKAEYDEKIDQILLKRNLEREKKQYEALLKDVSEREITLDILKYINKLKKKEKIDVQKISNNLGYKQETVQKILKKILKGR